jgi:hypothetical protein
MVRHGRGDACITLNVCGTEFQTLRSTVNANAVLADHVARAEANKEMTRNGAVFIDRDPKNFSFILQHLRNRVEMLKYSSSSVEKMAMQKFTETYVRLPEDKDILRDLYIEATYYRIPELQGVLTKSGFLVKLLDQLTNGNPFDKANKLAAALRNFLILFGTFGGVIGTILVAAKHDFEHILERLGLKKDQEEEGAGGILETVGLKKKKKDEKSNDLEVSKALKEVAESLTK